jgi:hypothetical protein
MKLSFNVIAYLTQQKYALYPDGENVQVLIIDMCVTLLTRSRPKAFLNKCCSSAS